MTADISQSAVADLRVAKGRVRSRHFVLAGMFGRADVPVALTACHRIICPFAGFASIESQAICDTVLSIIAHHSYAAHAYL